MARKRKLAANASCRPRKLLKPCAADTVTSTPSSLLALYYPKVLILKDFFLARLPSTSRVRRRRIETLAAEDESSLLNTVLVGILTDPGPAVQQARAAELVTFTQSQRGSTEDNTARGQTHALNEVLDFVIWTLFRKSAASLGRPRHVLCNGLQRANHSHNQSVSTVAAFQIPGIVQQHFNDSLRKLRQSPWDNFLTLLGADGATIFSSLLLDSGIFIQLPSCKTNYFQLSGCPISELKLVREVRAINQAESQAVLRKPSDIRFVRNRILYAKSSLNGKGHVHVGLRHVHVLQRYHRHQDESETVHVLKHIFPRQFGLHNVFTSPINPKEASQPLPDYTYREDELTRYKKHPKYWVPKRLRGAPLDLIRRLRKSHSTCSYSQLLRHYCPVLAHTQPAVPRIDDSRALDSGSAPLVTQFKMSSIPKSKSPSHQKDTGSNLTSFMSYATPTPVVAVFCKRVISHLLPGDALGYGAEGQHNWHHLLNSVDNFLISRRYETLTLHEVCQNIKISTISWLRSSKDHIHQKLSTAEFSKRIELLHEFFYYIFDSLLIPLIRTNFYVTESGPLRNKLTYFRHDVWRKLAAPSLAMLRMDLYQPLAPQTVRRSLDRRSLGYSNVRLLPKAEGTRVITNLKRKMTKSVNGRRVYGPSVNTQLAPIFSALNYERHAAPERVGAALFSVSDLYMKLGRFKEGLSRNRRLYFVKVDVQSCFDTIPQERLIRVIEKIVDSTCYKTTKYTEVGMGDRSHQRRQKFVSISRPADTGAAFSEAIANDIAQTKRGVVLAEVGNARNWQRSQLIQLLQDHVRNNIVKIGKKHLRQKNGIPQGSILSSILCSYFYAAFESEHLGFLDPRSSLLLRLIDDFLLITTDKGAAKQFAETMMHHHPAFGISTNAEKTLTNFHINIGSKRIPQHRGRDGFPYCGTSIDPHTLEVSKDREKRDLSISNGLTVDTIRPAGATFRRKMLLAFKIQMQAMFVDAALNSRIRVLRTLMEAFCETGMKLHQYMKSLKPRACISERIVISVVEDLVALAYRYARDRCSIRHELKLQATITMKQMCWMASSSIERVLCRKQSRHAEVLVWLRALRGSSEASMGMSSKALDRLLDDCERAFRGYIY